MSQDETSNETSIDYKRHFPKSAYSASCIAYKTIALHAPAARQVLQKDINTTEY